MRQTKRSFSREIIFVFVASDFIFQHIKHQQIISISKKNNDNIILSFQKFYYKNIKRFPRPVFCLPSK
jgi:hypothetical protein